MDLVESAVHLRGSSRRKNQNRLFQKIKLQVSCRNEKMAIVVRYQYSGINLALFSV